MVIYVDVLIIVNFIISYFLLLTAALMSGYTYIRKRIIFASIIGALFCLYIFVDISNIVFDYIIKILSLLICSVTAFGFNDKRKLIIHTLYYVLLNALLTGVIYIISQKTNVVFQNNLFYYFRINPVMLVVFSALIYLFLLFLELLKEKLSPQSLYSIDIVFEAFELKDVVSFYDSGFKIKDLISNKDVIILSTNRIKEYLPLNLLKDINNYLSEKYNSVEFLFIPVMFNTLSGNGVLPAIKTKYILYNDKKIKNVIVAFTDERLSGNIDAIFGSDIKKQL